MCGISGIINKNGFAAPSIKDMSDLIKHRGPDDEGYLLIDSINSLPVCFGGPSTPKEVFSFDSSYKPTDSIETNKISRPFLAFGHRRLSILDLSSAGHQPMSYANGRYWIIFNGEIYNYLEIKHELISKGHTFVSNSDTEVILASWQEWGVDCQHKFNGMWAFVIYDCEEKELFISRDRFGIKPFYYWFAPDGSFCFGSEIKQFTEYKGWKARLNPQRAYDYLIYSYTDHTNETMFSGVNQIPGGYYFLEKIDNILPDKEKKIIATKWYSIPEQPFQGTFEEASKQFEILFKSAVELHLRADVPVGTALSGGLDSSAIVCEMNNLLKKVDAHHLQKTFSCCSIDERYSEKKWIDIVIEQTSTESHFVYPELKDVFSITDELIWMHDEPYQSQSPFLAYNVFKLVKENDVKVLLNGQGADEYLGGYGQFMYVKLIKKFRAFKWLEVYKEIKDQDFKKFSKGYLLRIILASAIPDKLRGRLFESFNGSSIRKNLINNKVLGSKNVNADKQIPVNLYNVKGISQHQTFFSTLPKYLKWEDRNSMSNSIEARVPFLDYRLVEFTYNLPDDYLDYKGETKRVMRNGLKDILPEKIRNRKDKNGYLTPEERWVKKDDPALFRKKIEEAIKISKGIIKPKALEYFDKIIAGKIPFDYTYWRLILFSIWLVKFNILIE